jgi:hypothetical protein
VQNRLEQQSLASAQAPLGGLHGTAHTPALHSSPAQQSLA